MRPDLAKPDRDGPIHQVASLLIAFACAWVLPSGAAIAQTVDPSLWVANGPVYTIVRDGSTIYIGGHFSQVGPASGGGTPFDVQSDALPVPFPKVAGIVYVVI